MPGPLSLDLRRRVVEAYEGGAGSLREVAAQFAIGIATAKRLMWRRRATGDVQPRARGGGMPRRISDENLSVLATLVHDKPDRTIAELAKAFTDQTSLAASTSTISRALVRLNLTRKKRRSMLQNATVNA